MAFYAACFTMSLLAPMTQALRLHLLLPSLWFNPKTPKKLSANWGKLLSTLNKLEQREWKHLHINNLWLITSHHYNLFFNIKHILVNFFLICTFFHLLLGSKIFSSSNLSIFIWSELIKLNSTNFSWPLSDQNEDGNQVKMDFLKEITL